MTAPLDETPLTFTLPAAAWVALRYAAKQEVRKLRRRASERRVLAAAGHVDDLSGRDLNEHRADVLAAAIEEITPTLTERGL